MKGSCTMQSEEHIVDETLVEETPVEEKPVEETPAEETPVEEAPVEETTQEEKVVEEAKNKKGWKIAGIICASIAVCVLFVYFAGVFYYSNHLFMRTSVNYAKCSNMTIEEVKKALQSSVKSYELNILCLDGEEELIKGSDFNLTYEGTKNIEELFEKQNPFAWPKSMFVDSKKTVSLKLQYNKDVLRILLSQLNCMKEERQVVPIAATVVLENGTFVIREERKGTEINFEKLVQVSHQRVRELRSDIDLIKEECYVEPKFLKDSQSVLEAQKEMNQYLNAQITYQMDSQEVTLSSEDFATWITLTEDMKPGINQQEIRNFVKNLSTTYNTPNRSGILVTPTGKEVNISNASLGRVVDTEGEVAQITEEIKSGEIVEREPLFSRYEMADGEYVWGDTYIEVDISEQYMWYIVNGDIRLETPVVTGMKGKMDTPAGIFKVLEKKRNKTLIGQMVNGKPLYRQPVSFWMRITWSGVGFHDASWQASFGGDRYVTHGSHGCINMPWGKARELYNMLSNGTSVVIHY